MTNLNKDWNLFTDLMKNLNLNQDTDQIEDDYVTKAVDAYMADDFQSAFGRTIRNLVGIAQKRGLSKEELGLIDDLGFPLSLTRALLVREAAVLKQYHDFRAMVPGVENPYDGRVNAFQELCNLVNAKLNDRDWIDNVDSLGSRAVIEAFGAKEWRVIGQEIGALVMGMMDSHPDLEISQVVKAQHHHGLSRYSDMAGLMINELAAMLHKQGLATVTREFAEASELYFIARDMFMSTREIYSRENILDASDIVVNYQAAHHSLVRIYDDGCIDRDSYIAYDGRVSSPGHMVRLELMVLEERKAALDERIRQLRADNQVQDMIYVE